MPMMHHTSDSHHTVGTASTVRRPTEEAAIRRADRARRPVTATLEELLTRLRHAMRIGDRYAVQKLNALLAPAAN